eukprot:SM000110S18898  [mRNA]  locus=s110:162624:163503:- [translate_table: standard]
MWGDLRRSCAAMAGARRDVAWRLGGGGSPPVDPLPSPPVPPPQPPPPPPPVPPSPPSPPPPVPPPYRHQCSDAPRAMVASAFRCHIAGLKTWSATHATMNLGRGAVTGAGFVRRDRRMVGRLPAEASSLTPCHMACMSCMIIVTVLFDGSLGQRRLWLSQSLPMAEKPGGWLYLLQFPAPMGALTGRELSTYKGWGRGPGWVGRGQGPTPRCGCAGLTAGLCSGKEDAQHILQHGTF